MARAAGRAKAAKMKTCPHCGLENDDGATGCRQCGAGLGPGGDPGRGDRLERACVLDNEAQAGLMDAILAERAIPHVMQTYHDSAYDGLFQVQQGWGVVLAPPAFRNEVRAILAELRQQSQPGA